ncbi:MAG: DNA polymerase, partial [Clostridiales bacterium]
SSMEQTGFAVDRDGIAEFGKQLGGRIAEIEQEIYALVGYEFNLNSPKQLGEALFEKLKLPARKKTKSGYSTDAQVLESLENKHPAVRDILEYRTLSKLRSTYCDGLLKVIGEDGRIRSTLNQTETRTGRISSTEPNLQNIPVRSPLGREMRKFFVARDGYVLVDADYSQIELRVLAHISGDRNMIKAFNDNTDIHTVTASEVFDMPPQLVTPIMRSRAKAVNFGIVYGIGAFSLAKDIGVSRSEADEYIKGYLGHYSGVDKYMHDVVEKAKKDGYAETMFARRRYLPELTASNANTRAFGERVARNMPIQGTAADIIKLAMLHVDRALPERKLRARLVLQVHDELIVECPVEERVQVTQLLTEQMQQVAKLSVPLLAEAKSGASWYEAK